MGGQTVKIRVSYGVTRNAGNFESVRADVSMEKDCRAGEEHATTDELWVQCYKEAEKKLSGLSIVI